MGIRRAWATGYEYTRESVSCMRVSSITTAQLVDEFHHVGGQFAAETDVFARERVNEAQLGRMERLAGKAESFEQRTERFGGASIDRVSQ